MLRRICFRDRESAGEKLAQLIVPAIEELAQNGSMVTPIVYALPCGGIPVAIPIAHQLGCPLNLLIAKKITTPHSPEFAIGAVSSQGDIIWSNFAKNRQLDRQIIEDALQIAQQKAHAQQLRFSASRPQVSARGKIAILVDDGIATGMTAIVAMQALRREEVSQLWLATPVIPADLVVRMEELSDRLVYVSNPPHFGSVSSFYRDFPQVSEEEAMAMLAQFDRTN